MAQKHTELAVTMSSVMTTYAMKETVPHRTPTGAQRRSAYRVEVFGKDFDTARVETYQPARGRWEPLGEGPRRDYVIAELKRNLAAGVLEDWGTTPPILKEAIS